MIPAVARAAPPAEAAAPAAAPLAQRQVNLDGDGAPERIRLSADGQLSVVSGRTGRVLAWKTLLGGDGGGPSRSGTIDVATGKHMDGHTVILALLHQGPSASSAGEALAAEWRRGRLVELWRGAVGPQGPDGEWTRYVEAGRHGLVRYAGRVGVSRCDGQTAYLYADRWDFAGAGRFRPVTQVVGIGPGAPVLAASRTAPPGARAGAEPVDFRALAASSQLGVSDAGELAAPSELEDGDATTAWVEGRADFGRGEFVTARATLDHEKVRAVRIVPGHSGSAGLFARYNRLKRVGLLVGRDHAYWVEFKDDPLRDPSGSFRDPYWVILPEPVEASCVSLVVSEVYFGERAGRKRRAGDTAVSDLAVLTTLDLEPGRAAPVLAARVARGGRAGDQAADVLARMNGSAAEAALLAEAQKPHRTPGQLLALRRALAALPAPASPGGGGASAAGAAELARGLAEPGVSDADAASFARALARIGRPSVPALAQVVGDRAVSVEGRARCAAALGTISGAAAHAALLAAAGNGPGPLRDAVVQALAARPPAELDALVAAARAASHETEAREADLWRAAGRMASGKDMPADAPARVVQALSARLGSATGYELKGRLIDAAGQLGGPLATAALVKAMARERGQPAQPPSITPAEAQRIALRRMTAEALGRSGGPAAAQALASAAHDPDPGVRNAAARALGEIDSPPAAGRTGPVATLGGILGTDTWPRVRRSAAESLGQRCTAHQASPSPALRRAVLSDPDIDVQTAALSALAGCGGPAVPPFLLVVLRDPHEPAALRGHAARLLGGLGDKRLTAPLTDQLDRQRQRAFSQQDAVDSGRRHRLRPGRPGRPRRPARPRARRARAGLPRHSGRGDRRARPPVRTAEPAAPGRAPPQHPAGGRGRGPDRRGPLPGRPAHDAAGAGPAPPVTQLGLGAPRLSCDSTNRSSVTPVL